MQEQLETVPRLDNCDLSRLPIPVPQDFSGTLAGDKEAERGLVAYYLILGESSPKASPVKPQHFSYPLYRSAWQKALAMHQVVQPSDLGFSMRQVSELMDVFVAPSTVRKLEHRLISAASARVMMERLAGVVKALNEGGAEALNDAVADARAAVNEADAGMPTGSRSHADVVKEVAIEWARSLEAGDDSKHIIPMIPTMHAAFGGWRTSKLTLIIGRPSEHKTTIARIAAAHAAQKGYKATGWTFEDESGDLAARTMAADMHWMSYRDFILGEIPRGSGIKAESIFGEVRRHQNEGWGNNLRWMDTGSPTLSEVIRRIRTEVSKHGTQLFTLEYCQLIRPDRGREDVEHTKLVASSLAALAKELGIAIVAVLQIDKTAAKETMEGGLRPPQTKDVSGGVAWWHACNMSLCLSAGRGDRSRKLTICADKNKDGKKGEIVVEVDPARDAVIEREER